jgi:AcrR family transcriptional regulator
MRPNRRNEIIAATIREAARHGVSGSTVRGIAAEAGVTEGAIYRHFSSKEELCQAAYCQIVAEMAEQKQEIVHGPGSIPSKFRSWIQMTFEYFDRFPDAFSYVLLKDHDFPPEIREVAARQGQMLTGMIEEAAAAGEIDEIDPKLAVCHFTGLMLNLPRLIGESSLPGPAVQYLDEVAGAVYRVFGIDAGKEETDRAGG